jgi:hypothetical protein
MPGKFLTAARAPALPGLRGPFPVRAHPRSGHRLDLVPGVQPGRVQQMPIPRPFGQAVGREQGLVAVLQDQVGALKGVRVAATDRRAVVVLVSLGAPFERLIARVEGRPAPVLRAASHDSGRLQPLPHGDLRVGIFDVARDLVREALQCVRSADVEKASIAGSLASHSRCALADSAEYREGQPDPSRPLERRPEGGGENGLSNGSGYDEPRMK